MPALQIEKSGMKSLRLSTKFPRIICHGLHNFCDAGVLVYKSGT